MNRTRVNVWVRLKPKIEAEAKRTGLSPSQVVNIVLASYFGVLPERIDFPPQSSTNQSNHVPQS